MHHLHIQRLCDCFQKYLESNHWTSFTHGEVIKQKEPVPLTSPAQFSNPLKVTEARSESSLPEGVSLQITLLRGKGDL
jgi:hypothetical protein